MTYKMKYWVSFRSMFLVWALFSQLLVGASRSDPVDFQTPAEILADSALASRLTWFEKKEIKEYPEIYYTGEYHNKIIPIRTDRGVIGYDDEKGRYRCGKKDHVAYQYEIIGALGKGSYGDVVAAFDHKRQKQVAIKILRNGAKYFQAGMVEQTFLQRLGRCQKAGDEKTVCFLATMFFRNHVCLVLEFAEGGDLYEALERKKAMAHRDGRGGFSLEEVSIFHMNCWRPFPY